MITIDLHEKFSKKHPYFFNFYEAIKSPHLYTDTNDIVRHGTLKHLCLVHSTCFLFEIVNGYFYPCNININI